MLPAATGEPHQTDEDLKWQALKRQITRERLRDKQEQEADAEVIRQRRERELKRKQDVMTLGEMKDQLKEFQTRLSSLTDAKHQLFLSLKKVLNEDDSRRRAVRESSSDVINVGGNYPQGLPANTIFLQPQRQPMYKVSPAGSSGPHLGPQGTGPIPVQGASIGQGPSGTKRPRSPSPPPHGYHPFNNFKTSPSLFPTSSANSSVSSPYAAPSSVSSPASASASQHGKSVQIQHQPQHSNPPQHSQDENRRTHDFPRAVLWNKGGAPPFAVFGGVYGVAPSGPVYSYASAPPGTYEQVYTSRQSYDGKPEGEKMYLRGPAGPLQMGVHSPHAPKAGLTTAFPVRPTHQHSAYLTPSGTGSTRLLYGSAHSTATVQSPAARYQSSGAL